MHFLENFTGKAFILYSFNTLCVTFKTFKVFFLRAYFMFDCVEKHLKFMIVFPA